MAKADPMAALLANANKKYNLTAGPMDMVVEGTKFVSTGNIAIDNAIGGGEGGLPLGRSVELFGQPSSGKTTTALQYSVVLQNIIKAGGDPELGIGADDYIIYFDYEQAMDKDYAIALGLDVKHPSLIFTQPDTLEDGANFALDALKTGRVRALIFDSVAAMVPSAKADAEIGKSLPAVQAKLMADFGMNLNVALANNNATAIFLNHEKEKMMMGGPARPGAGPVITTPGGIALKYFASVRVQYRQIRQNRATYIDPLTGEESQIPMSTDTKVKVVKNKVHPPYREALVRVRFGKGFDNFWTAQVILLAQKKIMHSGGMFYFHNLEADGLVPEWMARATTGTQRPYIKGQENLLRMADKHPEWREAIIAKATEIAKSADSLMPEAMPDDDDDDETQELDDLLEEASSAQGNRVKL